MYSKRLRGVSLERYGKEFNSLANYSCGTADGI